MQILNSPRPTHTTNTQNNAVQKTSPLLQYQSSQKHGDTFKMTSPVKFKGNKQNELKSQLVSQLEEFRLRGQHIQNKIQELEEKKNGPEGHFFREIYPEAFEERFMPNDALGVLTKGLLLLSNLQMPPDRQYSEEDEHRLRSLRAESKQIDYKRHELYKKISAIPPDPRGFDTVVGMEQVKQDLRLNFIRPVMKELHPERFKRTNIKTKPAQGLLLYGPPGTGKSFIAEKLADELEMNPHFAKATDLEGPYIGHTQERIQALFNKAASKKPCLLIIDEFDQIAKKIKKGTEDDRSWNDTKRAAILVELQKAAERGILVVGTTNKHPSELDGATVREQRIDVHVQVPLPDKETRIGLFKMYIGESTESDEFPFTDKQIESLASKAEGFSSATIQSICETAARKADLDDADGWDLIYLEKK